MKFLVVEGMMMKARRRWIYRRPAAKSEYEGASSAHCILLNDSGRRREQTTQNRFSSTDRRAYAMDNRRYLSARDILLAANGYGVLRRPLQDVNLN
jgi:hypothetical protein